MEKKIKKKDKKIIINGRENKKKKLEKKIY